MNDDKNTPKDPFREDINEAVRVLKRGGIILYPTDTVWGIGCDATNADAVARIYELKQRALTKSMLVLMDSVAMVERYIDDPSEVALQLMSEATTPVTVILDNAIGLASNLISEDGSIGVRIPDERYCQALLRGLRRPIVSTSANISGHPTPAIFSEIEAEVCNSVDYIAHYHRNDTSTHKPSSIIKISKGGLFKIIRK
ncbi:MAG: L-threonylcarbamoyladenylate synthase [Muribaculaceae bacterium]|nr:L-threonylcarbamoyladenylate synthase [Muribaculaceae bacterium]